MLLEKLSETLQGIVHLELNEPHLCLTYFVEIVKFREMIEKQESPLQSLPDEYFPLIAKLGHER